MAKNAAKDAREAAVLLEVAEGHNRNEEDEDALIAAQDALKLFRTAKDNAKVADSLRIIIQCYVSQGRLEEATALAKEERAAFKKGKNKAEEAKLALSLSEVYAKQKKLVSEALGLAKESLALFREVRDEKMEAKVWLHTAKVLLTQKDKELKEGEDDPLKGAAQAANDALKIYKTLKDEKEGLAAAMQMTAEVKAAEGEIDEAIEIVEDALDVLQDIKQPKLEAFMLSSIATMCTTHKKPWKALHFAQDALQIIRDLGGSKRKEVAALDAVVQAMIAKDMKGQAVGIAWDGLQRFQNAGETRAEAETHRVLYTAFMANGDIESAVSTMDKALEASQDAGDKTMEIGLLIEASNMLHKAYNFDKAVETAWKALELCKESKEWEPATKALQIIVDVHLMKGESKQAVEAAKDMQELLEAADSPKHEARCCLILSQCHVACENFDLASAAAKAATEIAYKEDDESLEASALDQLSQVYLGSGKFEKAAHAAESSRRIWKELEDLPRECNALDQAGKAYIQQAYKKQASGKSTSSVSSIFEKAAKAANDCIELVKELPAHENGKAFSGNAYCTLSQVHAAMGESDEALATADAAAGNFWEAGDESSGAYAAALKAQALVQKEEWDAAKGDANNAIGIFRRFENFSGAAFVEKILDTIARLQPKPPEPEPTLLPPGMMMVPQGSVMMPPGGMPGGMMPQGMPQGMPQQQMQQQQDPAMMQQMQNWQPAGGGGGGGVGGMLNLNQLDLSAVSEEAVAAKVKEVALAIIGDDMEADEEVEADTPLMEAGLTSSTAVVMRDELVAVIPGVKISPTAMFDYPSIAAMTEMLMEQLNKKK